MLFVGDVHAPDHDAEAWSVMMAYARRWKPNVVVQLGDLLDAYSVSSFEKDASRKLLLLDEARSARKLLSELASLRPERKVYLLGNHEARVDKYIARHAGALTGCVDVRELLRTRDSGWEVVPYNKHLRVGKLFCSHDAGGSGDSAHIKAMGLFGSNVIQGHTHQLALGYRTSATGRSLVGCMAGWLGRADRADYASDIQKARWMHGFVLGHLETSGNVHLRTVPIVKGKVLA